MPDVTCILLQVKLAEVANPDPDERLIALDAALTELAVEDPRRRKSPSCITLRAWLMST